MIPQQAKDDFFNESLKDREIFVIMSRGNQWQGLGCAFAEELQEHAALGKIIAVEGNKVTIEIDPKLLV